jgi:hypothetical protein
VDRTTLNRKVTLDSDSLHYVRWPQLLQRYRSVAGIFLDTIRILIPSFPFIYEGKIAINFDTGKTSNGILYEERALLLVMYDENVIIRD